MLTHELHRHLDASFRASTIAELTQKYKLNPSFHNAAEVEQSFHIKKPLSSLKAVLDCFDLFQKILLDDVVFERVAYEATLDASLNESIEHIEFRYSPSFASHLSSVPWSLGLSSIQSGIARAKKELELKYKKKIDVGLIGIISRDMSEEDCRKSVDFFVQSKKDFCGVDLAGNEFDYPARLFEKHFRHLRDAGLKTTIHAGEAAGPESVWDAIDVLGAQRIGHGVNAIKDKTLMRRLERDGIVIESCPISNLMTSAVSSMKKHPLPKFLDAGIHVTIGTDDPGIFGNTLLQEREILEKTFGFGPKEFLFINESSRKGSFLNAS